jgi:hypothetical protein
MKYNFLEIKELLESSKLTEDEQQEFLGSLLRIGDEQLVGIKEILKHDINTARVLYDNYHRKKETVKKKQDLGVIFSGEVEYLDKIQKGE